MAFNYLYPVSTVESNFDPVASGHLNIDEWPPAIGPNEFIIRTISNGFATFQLDENDVYPGLVQFRFSSSYDTEYGAPYEPTAQTHELSFDIAIEDSEGIQIAGSSLDFIQYDTYRHGGILTLPVSGDIDENNIGTLYLKLAYAPAQNKPTSPVPSAPTISQKNFVIFATEVFISGTHRPETNDLTLFMKGPCGHKGDIQARIAIDEDIQASGDFWQLAYSGIDGGFDVKSLRFGVPNSTNSFSIESGFATPTEAAFYGIGNSETLGQHVDDRFIDGLEFWTDYASGLLVVSGNNPYFCDNVPFIAIEENVIRFSGGYWPDVEVRVDDANNTSDFRFKYLDRPRTDYVAYLMSATDRTDFFVAKNGATNRFSEFPFNDMFSATDYEAVSFINRFCYNYVTNDVIYTDDDGLVRLNLDNSESVRIVEQSGVMDVDLCYEDNKIYYVTSDAIYSCALMGPSGTDQELSLPTSLPTPRISVFNPSNLMVGSISGATYHGVKTAGWNLSSVPISASSQYDVESIYFESGYVGTLIAADSKLYIMRHNTGFYSDITPTNWLGSGLVGMVYDEDQYLYSLHGRNTVRAFNLRDKTWFTDFAPLIGSNFTSSDIAIKQNKNYIDTTLSVWPLLPLDSCCNAAPSGFIQVEAGYSDNSLFGYADGHIEVSGEWIWRPLGNDVIKIEGENSFATVGYHDYEINGAEKHDYWRNATIHVKMHNFRDTVDIPSPTGIVYINNFEYRYEDCYTAADESGLDLFIVAGFNKDNVPLVTKASEPTDDNIPLFTIAGLTVDSIPLYINSHIAEDDNIPLYLLNQPQAEMNLFIEGTESEEDDASIDLFVNSTASPTAYDTCTMYMTAGFGEEINLYIGAGRGDDTANMNLFAGGIQLDAIKYADMIIWNDRLTDSGDFSMFLEGPTGSGDNGDMTLLIGGEYPESGPWNGEQLLIINNKTASSEDTSLYVGGAIETNDNATMTISGRHVIDDETTFYTHGF